MRGQQEYIYTAAPLYPVRGGVTGRLCFGMQKAHGGIKKFIDQFEHHFGTV
jgi:hypothetical protein